MNGSTIRFVIDTNVLFEGLTKKGSASSFLIDAWYAELFQAYISTTLAYEYADVLSRKLSARRWSRLQPALGRLLQLSSAVTVHYSWRPISPDIGDDHVVDCAMNAGASVVTWNQKDFRAANETLGLPVLTPVGAVALLVDEEIG
ncbi:PIN domain-containing protein [Chloroflexi bacterium TSY]|nr:PIN domain-containing protein [Chloroflexi bacterium TSY]